MEFVVADIEELKFDAEVGKVLSLVVHSLYTNKDIFLRELLSNASDACDKLRHEFLSNHDLMEEGEELKVVISVDKDSKQLSICDNGIGMNRDELIANLGTIASSGTQRFLEALGGDKAKGYDLIGKFGVGFYSVFMVASEVVVDTCRAGESVGYRWRSSGDGGFTIEKLGEDVPRGTKITLTLKEDESGFLDKFRIEHVVTTYSDHLGYPVYFLDEKGEEEKLNSGIAIWTKPKAEVTAAEHLEFFRSVAHIGSEPWMVIHNKNEGAIEYTNLLYIPSVKPFDLFHPDRRCSVKLYVNRVFITEDNVQIIPQYLRFIRGVIDSSDLPLNISRETLQNNRIVEKIKTSVTKKVLSALKEKAESDHESYSKFWENFGPVLKEGLCEAMDTESREGVLSVCKFHTSACAAGELVSLADYISRMKPGQESIFYLSGDDLESTKRSPQIEKLVSSGIEVILLVDPVDDFWTSVVSEYKGVPFKSVMRVGEKDLEKCIGASDDSGDKTSEDSGESASDKESIGSFIEYLKKVLDGVVSDVRVSKKLTTSLVCLAVPDNSMDIRMERFLREQKQLNYKGNRILEINIDHPIAKSLLKEHEARGESELLNGIVHLLYDEACIIEGEEIRSTVDFASRINGVLAKIFSSK
ncbi:heat shock protein 90 [Anaplasma phagocytophilum str. HGE1]|nr:molecular chaperone HtpG [Anaplasma phagocytophilum]AGR78938.1 heat shock protein Hsp90 [Anaplasma phagocytophilum str. HZ2]AGR80185.1 heat shock protein Hsp90 [Anaplasma phagocytophilum str. JM]AGR81440.1 heat shock protein Hsp90 [Anaplasma phagocytophilum str. Dog2]EOA61147.1 heat shock protein 90 [Anaplasma phagocytophilum str. HGE1]PLC10015.1 molecular chaperone HtpG [Anaplasma phagocytophilum]